MEHYRETLQELYLIERQIRITCGIPNGGGTVRYAMSLEGEEPVVLPRVDVDGYYVIPLEAWGGFTKEQMSANITARMYTRG